MVGLKVQNHIIEHATVDQRKITPQEWEDPDSNAKYSRQD